MAGLRLFRRSVLMLPLAACVSEEAAAPAYFAPLRYDYLTPIRLNVASLEIQSRFVPPPGDLGSSDPVPPVEALRQMAQDRLHALGASGRATFTILDASLTRNRGSYAGNFAVQLDIYASDGTRAGFAESRATRTRTVDDTPLNAVLYEVTKTLMDTMNVEFEYQVRRSLRDWLIAAPAPAPAPVEQQPLPSPAS